MTELKQPTATWTILIDQQDSLITLQVHGPHRITESPTYELRVTATKWTTELASAILTGRDMIKSLYASREIFTP